MQWSMDYAFARIQEGFDGIFSNFTVPGISWIMRWPVGLWSRINRFGRGPSDNTGHQIAVALQTPGDQRDRHTAGIYLPTSDQKPLGRMDKAMAACFEADKLLSIVKKASRNGSINRGSIPDMVAEAVNQGVISVSDAKRIEVSEALREDAIQVDDFSLEEYKVSVSRNTVEQ